MFSYSLLPFPHNFSPPVHYGEAFYVVRVVNVREGDGCDDGIICGDRVVRNDQEDVQNGTFIENCGEDLRLFIACVP